MDGARHIRMENAGGVTIVTLLDSKLCGNEDVEETGAELCSLVADDGLTALLLDFSNVQYVDSPGFGKLIVVQKRLRDANGTMKICCVTPDLREVFRITRLDQVFDIYEDQQEALGAF